MVTRIETVQAEVAKRSIKSLQSLPIQSKSLDAVAPAIFWWDNFDRKTESRSGKSSIHNTPSVAFQEINNEAVSRDAEISLPESGRRALPKSSNEISVASRINLKTQSNCILQFCSTTKV